MELREYLIVLRRRWKLVLVPALLAAAVAGGLVASSPTYESTTILYARASQQTALSTSVALEERLRSYVQLASERRLAAEVDDRLGLPETPKELQETISARSNDLLLYITAEHSTSQNARAMADASADQLRSLVAELEQERRPARAPLRLTVVQEASPPTTDTAADVAQSTGFGVAFGLLLGVVAALVREALDTSVKSDRDVRESADRPALVHIPFDRRARRDPVGALQDGREGPRADSFRRLRVRLFPPGSPRLRRSLMVTGSTPGDGATSTACGLAVTLAESGLRVVLVGVDSVQSPLPDYLAVDDDVGLTDVVVGGVPVDMALQAWGDGKLQVIPAGTAPASPSEVMRSDGMALLVKELENRFDLVIVDAPPLLAFAEAAVLAAATDGAILAVRHGRTRRGHVRESMDLLSEVGADVLGVVLTGLPRRSRRAFRVSPPRSRRRHGRRGSGSRGQDIFVGGDGRRPVGGGGEFEGGDRVGRPV